MHEDSKTENMNSKASHQTVNNNIKGGGPQISNFLHGEDDHE